MSDDPSENTGNLANEQMERERRLLFGKHGSGDLTQTIGVREDKRVTSAIQWLWAMIGAAAVAGVYWTASSITNLNVTLERALVRLEYQDKRLDLNEAEIKQLRREVAELQGKVFRGLDGYEQP